MRTYSTRSADAALGVYNSFHYSEVHKSPENKAYTEAYAKAYPKDRPNFMSVAGYDGMHLIAEVLKKTGGDTDGEKFIAAAKGMSWVSPRGKSPSTRRRATSSRRSISARSRGWAASCRTWNSTRSPTSRIQASSSRHGGGATRCRRFSQPPESRFG